MKKMLLILLVLSFNTLYSQEKDKSSAEFNLEYSVMRITDFIDPKEESIDVKTIVSFNTNFNGKIIIKSEDGLNLELYKTEKVEKLFDPEENMEFLSLKLQDRDRKKYRFLIFPEKDSQIILYLISEDVEVIAYQFLKI